MDPALLGALLHDLAAARTGFDTLVLFWLGEPTLHPHFSTIYQEILRLNERAGIFGRVEVHTNATRLFAGSGRVAVNRARTEQVWHFSLDAARSSTWRRIKGTTADFRAIERSIKELIDWKSTTGAPWPRLVLQFILSSRNVDEAAHFKYRWERVFRARDLPVVAAVGRVPPGTSDVIFFRQPDCPTAEEQARENLLFKSASAALGLPVPELAASTTELRKQAVCSGHWKSPVIAWNGDLTVCTRDSNLALKVGNLRETPFSRLWWGPEMTARRAALAAGDLSMTPACRGCFIPGSGNYVPISPLEIRRLAEWAALDTQEDPS